MNDNDNDNDNDTAASPEQAMPTGAQAEAQVFSAIVRYIAERLTEIEPDVDPGDLAPTGQLFIELADAFEATSGFEFDQDQALPLSHAFAMLEGGMRVLAEQATESGHTNAAAKMEWAAIKARAMTGILETNHMSGSGGIIAFGLEDEAEAATESTDKPS
ncbi:hypothetical protein V5T82_02035 [Magnetovibrio sp. PR-2]|uniref:hypothetical protein n=1 Tax=Magnetovibrio sp. PR-2 TaxID=3120356 RepID=UPI002FCDE655